MRLGTGVRDLWGVGITAGSVSKTSIEQKSNTAEKEHKIFSCALSNFGGITSSPLVHLST